MFTLDELRESIESKFVVDKEASKKITTITEANFELLKIFCHSAVDYLLVGAGGVATIVTAKVGGLGIAAASVIGGLTLAFLGYKLLFLKKNKAHIKELKELKQQIRLEQEEQAAQNMRAQIRVIK